MSVWIKNRMWMFPCIILLSFPRKNTQGMKRTLNPYVKRSKQRKLEKKTRDSKWRRRRRDSQYDDSRSSASSRGMNSQIETWWKYWKEKEEKLRVVGLEKNLQRLPGTTVDDQHGLKPPINNVCSLLLSELW